MYLTIRLKQPKKAPVYLSVDIPNGTRNANDDLNNVVLDYIKKNGIKYQWYDIESMPNFPIQRK